MDGVSLYLYSFLHPSVLCQFRLLLTVHDEKELLKCFITEIYICFTTIKWGLAIDSSSLTLCLNKDSDSISWPAFVLSFSILILLLTRVLDFLNRNWLEARQEIQTRLYWGPWHSSAQEHVTGSLAHAVTLQMGMSCFLISDESRGVSRGQASGMT